MFKSKLKSLSVMNKILLSYFILIFLIITFIASYNIYKDVSNINNNIISTISNVSSSLSKDDAIIDMVKSNKVNDSLNSNLDTIVNSISNVDLIVIVNNNDIRLYHPNKYYIGKHFSGGDESKLFNGYDSYITESVGTKSKQIRSFVSIKDNDNTVIGFVMVSAYTATIADIQNQIIINASIFFIISIFFGIILSYLLSRNIKKTLLGHEPVQLTEMYLQRKEVLDSLEEGIIAIDNDGTCLFYNTAAINMLKNSLDNDNLDIKDLINNFISNNLISTTLTGKFEYNIEMNINDISILINKIPIINDNNLIGAVSIFRDKTEVTKLAEELTGVNHIISALRANTHEHMNKLHVILGLLQIGDIDKATRYIGSVTSEQEKNYSMIINKIQNKTIAALILGKINRAKELDINFQLQSTSYLENHNPFLCTRDLVTIIGNLIENSMDALKSKKSIREINLYIFNDNNALTIIIDDTGCGIDSNNIPKICNRGFSTKGINRGIGLSLVNNIIKKSNGTFLIESELDTGTSISIIINRKRKYLKG